MDSQLFHLSTLRCIRIQRRDGCHDQRRAGQVTASFSVGASRTVRVYFRLAVQSLEKALKPYKVTRTAASSKPSASSRSNVKPSWRSLSRPSPSSAPLPDSFLPSAPASQLRRSQKHPQPCPASSPRKPARPVSACICVPHTLAPTEWPPHHLYSVTGIAIKTPGCRRCTHLQERGSCRRPGHRPPPPPHPARHQPK